MARIQAREVPVETPPTGAFVLIAVLRRGLVTAMQDCRHPVQV